MVCTVLFNQPILISLRQIANVKAARRFSTIFTKLMVTVFVKSFLLFGFWKNCWKYLYQGLAQGDFKIPFFIWKSFNAIRIPYMGKYEKTRKNKNRQPGTGGPYRAVCLKIPENASAAFRCAGRLLVTFQTQIISFSSCFFRTCIP